MKAAACCGRGSFQNTSGEEIGGIGAVLHRGRDQRVDGLVKSARSTMQTPPRNRPGSSAIRAASSDWRVSALARLPMVRSTCTSVSSHLTAISQALQAILTGPVAPCQILKYRLRPLLRGPETAAQKPDCRGVRGKRNKSQVSKCPARSIVLDTGDPPKCSRSRQCPFFRNLK